MAGGHLDRQWFEELLDAVAAEFAPETGPLHPAERKLDPVGADIEAGNARVQEVVGQIDQLDERIEELLQTPGAVDLTAKYRNGPRKVEFQGGTYLRPTIIRCDSWEHSLANREFLCPYASVVEVKQSEVLSKIGYSLIVTAITQDPAFINDLLECGDIDRLNIGPISTMKISWNAVSGAASATSALSGLLSVIDEPKMPLMGPFFFITSLSSMVV